MGKCRYFVPNQVWNKENCPDCKRWNGKRCRDETMLRKQYEDSKEFTFFDSLMRNNKPIEGPL